MKIITPITITESMISAGTTVTEPAASEIAWVSNAVYALGDKRIRNSTHRVYRCSAAHSGSAVPPESDSVHWVDDNPTQRWAPFDFYTSTAAQSTGSMTFVLSPGFFNALALYGLDGAQVDVTVKDAPGGVVLLHQVHSIYTTLPDWYQYFFGTPKKISKLIIRDINISPTAELTITVSAAVGAPVAIGMIVVGDCTNLVGDDAEFGGTQYGASAEPMTYSYIDTDSYGNTTIVRRHAATGMRAPVLVPQASADQALAAVQDVLDVPVAWIAVDASGYDGLSVFGLGSARLGYEGPTFTTLDITVKGII